VAKPLVFALASYQQDFFQNLIVMDKRANLWVVASLMLLAGIPFEDLWEEHFLMRYFNTHSRHLAGEGAVGDLVTMGIPGVMGLDMSGSLAWDMPPMAKMALQLVGVQELSRGPFQSLAQNTIQLFNEGLSRESMARHFPMLAMRSVLKALQEHEGITTRSGRPLTIDGEPIRRTAMSAFLKSMGFNPADISALRSEMWRNRQLSDMWRERKNKVLDRLIRNRNDDSQHDSIKDEVRAFNKSLVEAKRDHGKSLSVSPIDNASVRRRLSNKEVHL